MPTPEGRTAPRRSGHAALATPPLLASRSTGHRIPALDGLRAVSIGLVLLGHLVGTRHFLTSFTALGDIGNLGVCVFFVISGFLITTLLLDEQARNLRLDLAAFYGRRVCRIIPAATLYLLVIAILASTIPAVHPSSSDWLHALTFTMNYHQNRVWCVGHLWSLAVEEQFYLLWPVVLVLFGRNRSLWLAGSAIAIAPLWRTLVWVLWPDARAGIGETFPTVMDAIAVGCVLAGSASWLAERVWYRRLLASGLFATAPAIVLLCNAFDRYPSFYLPIGMTVRNVGIAATVHWSILQSNRRVATALDSRSVAFAGRISYSLYLWQQLFIDRHRAALLVSFPVNLTCAVACALLSYTFIECPVLRLRERFGSARPPHPSG